MPTTSSLIKAFTDMGSSFRDELTLYSHMSISGIEWFNVRGSGRVRVVGCDSSRQYEVLRGFLVYAIQGVSVVYDSVGEALGYYSDAIASYITLGERWGVKTLKDTIISSSAKTLEARLAYNASSRVDNIEYILFDGSYPSFVEALLVSKRLYGELARSSYSLWVDRVKLVGDLIEKYKVVFISKSVSKSYLTGEDRVKALLDSKAIRVPDFIVVDKISQQDTGYIWYENPYFKLKETTIEEAGKAGAKISRYYTLTYARLHPRGRIYQVTIPGKASREEVEEIIADLTLLSSEGYPTPLTIPHHTSRITRREFKDLLSYVLAYTETGREPLEHVLTTNIIRE